MIESNSVKQNLAKLGQVRLDVDGFSTALIELTGTFVGTVVFEYTINGEDWNTLTVNVFGASSTATGATAAGKWLVNVAGLQQIRVRSTAYTSGTVEVCMRAVSNGGVSAESVTATNKVSSANTPEIASSTTAIAANAARKGWLIQNLGTNPLFVRLGASASTTVFHSVLKGGTGNDDGLGGSMSQMDGVIYTGVISIAGTSPRYTVLEL